jgi:hypothetical protein
MPYNDDDDDDDDGKQHIHMPVKIHVTGCTSAGMLLLQVQTW